MSRTSARPGSSLASGLNPLQAWFEHEADHVRVLAIHAATCPLCVRAIREALEPLFALKADFRMAWIFIDMMKTDTLAAAAAEAARVHDPRLTAFHDPGHQVGRAMARTLGWQRHVAWDTCFVYRAGTRWAGTEMPTPHFWYHQLRDREIWEQTAEAELGSTEWTRALADTSEADPAHFATGDDLRIALAEAVAQAGSPTSPGL